MNGSFNFMINSGKQDFNVKTTRPYNVIDTAFVTINQLI